MYRKLSKKKQEKQPYNDNVEEIDPEFSTYFSCDQVTNILETSPPVVYAVQRKVGQYLKACHGMSLLVFPG